MAISSCSKGKFNELLAFTDYLLLEYFRLSTICAKALRLHLHDLITCMTSFSWSCILIVHYWFLKFANLKLFLFSLISQWPVWRQTRAHLPRRDEPVEAMQWDTLPRVLQVRLRRIHTLKWWRHNDESQQQVLVWGADGLAHEWAGVGDGSEEEFADELRFAVLHALNQVATNVIPVLRQETNHVVGYLNT